jgi:hypothetical protein
MAILLEVYNDMVKQAQENAEKAVIAERVEWLDKYAALATELLQAEFPNDYAKEDVVELADKLIDRDLSIADAQQKHAEATALLGEYVDVSRQLMEKEYGKDFTNADVEKLASALYEMDAAEELAKEAGTILEVAFIDEFNKLADSQFESLEQIDEFMKSADLAAIGAKGKDLWNATKGKVTDFAKKYPKTTAGAALTGAAGAGFMAGRSGEGDGK